MEVELTKLTAREFANSVGFRYVENEVKEWLSDIRDQLESPNHSHEVTCQLRGNAETVRNLQTLFEEIKLLAGE